MVILDDCFSGLDVNTEDKIFNRLLGKNGLLRKTRTTVILATHAVHRLPFADHVIALSADGQIAEQGTFQHLMAHGKYVPTLSSKRRLEEEHAATEEQPPVLEALSNPAEGRVLERAVEDANRSSGDWAIWRYYFRTTGLGNVAGYLASMLSFGIFMKMPGTCLRLC